MSRPRYWWFPVIQKILRRYPKQLEVDNTPQGTLEMKMIKEAIQETSIKYENSEERLAFIEMLYFSKTHTLEGAAYALYVHPQTAKKWNHDFI